MHPNLHRAHLALWQKFFCPETNLIYDTAFHEPAHLPTTEEIYASIPNCAGWGTGMEDCALTAGFVLDAMVTAHRVTSEECWAGRARQIFRGLVKLGQVSRTRGFVARGFAPGSTAIYPNSSADQYTSFVYGLWRYARSPIARPAERQTATELIVDVALLVESFDHNIPREDMRPSIYGDTNTIEPGRACRILEFYKAAYDLSGDRHWQEVYMQKVEEKGRARLACHYGPEVWPLNRNVHAVVQSQVAFRLLYETENDAGIRAAYKAALRAEAQSVIGRIPLWREIVARPMGKALPPQWRRFWPSFIQKYPEYNPAVLEDVRKFSQYCRDHAAELPPPADVLAAAEPALPWLRHQTESLATVMLCEEDDLRCEAAREAWPMLTEVDWTKVAQAGVWECLDLGYWRGVEAGVFTA